jgi:hypothetical protein
MGRELYAVFKGVEGGGLNFMAPGLKLRYPARMYKDGCDPILVENTEAEEKARLDGYDSITASAMSNPYLINWFWDLEDMSSKQLVTFAKDEFDVQLPIEAGQDRLFTAVLELSRNAPQNQNRLILMAHTIKMEYDATLDEIRRMVKRNAPGTETEVKTFEVMM